VFKWMLRIHGKAISTSPIPNHLSFFSCPSTSIFLCNLTFVTNNEWPIWCSFGFNHTCGLNCQVYDQYVDRDVLCSCALQKSISFLVQPWKTKDVTKPHNFSTNTSESISFHSSGLRCNQMDSGGSQF